ncbi:gliding motility protein GldN [Mucilaginibacter sp. PAMC 26640]|nr:gliding motility protein GldN [Mucilaginibacter sp. PAMC 26640]
MASVCTPGRFTILRPAFIRPLDGAYRKTDMPNATKISAYANLREGDASFVKRIWREIDLREKMNQYIASPKQGLMKILMDGIESRDIVAYNATATKDNPNGDTFNSRLTAAQARQRLADSSVVDIFDKKSGDKTGSKVVAGEFNPDDVLKFRIKEDWYFDKQRGIFEPRIIGIAPLIKVKTSAGVANNEFQPAFWIYFPEVRTILATKPVVNRNSDATGLSYDDVFMKRLFTSHIVKQSNDKDERIRDYTKGIDQLYESERIKKGIADWEQANWQN